MLLIKDNPAEFNEPVEGECFGFKIGDRIKWKTNGKYENGTIKFIGYLKGETVLMAGIEWDDGIGAGTGVFNKEQLFHAKNNHAGFVSLSTIELINPINILTKRFKLKFFFNFGEIKSGKLIFSPKENHFNIPWVLAVANKDSMFKVGLMCLHSDDQKKWSITARYSAQVISQKTGKNKIKRDMQQFNNRNNSGMWLEMMKWDNVKQDYIFENKVTVELDVEIMEIIGIRAMKLRKFDESVKEVSDVKLNVKGRAFYVPKLFLAGESSYFKTLFLGPFAESEKPEIDLHEIDPDDFHEFLELLYGESVIIDENVENLLVFVYMYDCDTAHRRCEEFLIRCSKLELKVKLRLSCQYKFKNLNKHCLNQIKTVSGIRNATPNDIHQLDFHTLAALFKKSLALHEIK